EMLGFLAEVGVPTLVAATKIDKLTRTQLAAHLAQLSEAIGMDEDQIIPFSSVTGAGRDDLAAAIVSLVADDATNDRPQSD
ncbi:MAG TPA: hypothetical protein VFT96_04975, partial [Gemmatimonadaceae bacterium]|nr:hypothetical protein [Gemmatimonadaceae bacterium]